MVCYTKKNYDDGNLPWLIQWDYVGVACENRIMVKVFNIIFDFSHAFLCLFIEQFITCIEKL